MISRKTLFGLVLALSLCFALAAPAWAAEAAEDNNVYIDLTQGHIFYDEDLGANIIPFTVNSDGTVNYLTEEEYIDSTSIKIEDIAEDVSYANEQTPTPYDYYQYYKFVKSSGPVVVNGPIEKITATLVAPKGGGSITKTLSVSITESFSANITLEAEKASVRRSAGITGGWQKSATNSTSYTVNLLPGERGYIGFSPKYYHVVGVLETYANWGDGLIGKRAVTADSVKKLSDGEADGTYAFIYE